MRFLAATARGDLFDRPDYHSTWQADIMPMPAMFGVLQSKYDDVVQEVDTIVENYETRELHAY